MARTTPTTCTNRVMSREKLAKALNEYLAREYQASLRPM